MAARKIDAEEEFGGTAGGTAGDMRMPEFSVIIPTRNRNEELRRCLRAIVAQDFPRERFEVIVCDDGSEIDVAPVIKEAIKDSRRGRDGSGGVEIRYARQESKGPAAARNLGIRKARGQIVAMTDSDTLPDRSWLRKLSETFDHDPHLAAVEGMVVADNEDEFAPLGEGPSNKTGGVFLTCNCAYRRNVLLMAGGFDETFPYPAYEDAELAARVRQIGPIAWQPEAVVIHPERQLTLRTVLKKLKHWEYVLVIGYRYGYLAWDKYPVKYPRLRVVLLSVIALPAAKLKTATKWLGRRPSAALKLVAYGMAESIGALLTVVPIAVFGKYRNRLIRQDYL